MANRKAPPIMVTLAVPAIIHCSCSTSLVTLNGELCGRAMSTVPMIGNPSWSRLLSDTATQQNGGSFGAMPPMPCPIFTNSWKTKAINIPSASKRMLFCKGISPIYSNAQSVAHPITSNGSTPTSVIRRHHGIRNGGWLPRSNGIRVSFILVLASSSPI